MFRGIRGCLWCIVCQKRLKLSRKADECKPLNGGYHGLVTCTADPSNAATGVLCGQCPGGYAGDAAVAGTGCLDVDECKDPTLVNGGCSPLVVCSNTMGGRTCGGCPAGYAGNGVTCGDVNECATANGGCDPLTACTNTVGARTCAGCPAGYKGSSETGCKRESACVSNNGGCDTLTAGASTRPLFGCTWSRFHITKTTQFIPHRVPPCDR